LITANKLLEDIVAPRKGVKPLFEPYHVLKALMILKDKEPIGRGILSKELSLGVSSTRTLMKRLKNYNLISIDPIGGCMLTAKGRLLISHITSIIKKISNVSHLINESIKLANYAYAALLSGYINNINSMGVTNVRDTLIHYGAKAAIIIFVNENHVYMPPDKELNEKVYPVLVDIARYMEALYGDVILMSYSDNIAIAESSLYNGLIAIVLQNIIIN